MSKETAKGLFGERPHFLHLCWMEGTVAMAAWNAGGRRLPADSRATVRGHTEATAARVAEWLDEAGAGRGGTRMVWSVVKEPLPAISAKAKREPGCLYEKGEAGRRLILADWVRRCWDGLPARHHPAAVLSAVRLLEEELRDWEPMRQRGEGFYFTLGERAFLFAGGDDGPFLRLGRKEQSEDGEVAVFAEGWLRQANFLYCERKGSPLRRLLLAQSPPDNLGTGLPEGMDAVWEVRPPGWPQEEGTGEGASLTFLHETARLRWTDPAIRTAAPSLARAAARHSRDAGLKAGAAIFLCGWILAAVSACRHAEAPSAETAMAEAFQAEHLRWQANYERARETRRRTELAEAPFLTVGSVLRTRPREVGLERIRLQRTDDLDRLRFVMKGNYKGREASVEFREWMHALRREGPVETVHNLHFTHAEEDRLRFTMEGSLNVKEVLR